MQKCHQIARLEDKYIGHQNRIRCFQYSVGFDSAQLPYFFCSFCLCRLWIMAVVVVWVACNKVLPRLSRFWHQFFWLSNSKVGVLSKPNKKMSRCVMHLASRKTRFLLSTLPQNFPNQQGVYQNHHNWLLNRHLWYWFVYYVRLEWQHKRDNQAKAVCQTR